MKFSEQWLREWVDPAVDTAQLAEQLTGLGLEVDAVQLPAALGEKVVVAKLVEVEQHPDADRLRVCQVDAGGEELQQIVCGAPNAREGLVAPLALPGARLPGGVKIRASKLRGVPSNGMLCSAKELTLAEDADGLYELPADAPIGQPVEQYLQLDDATIEIDLTPNRGDCLSIRGIAYDIAAINGLGVVEPAEVVMAAVSDARFPVSIASGSGCVRYVGRVIEDVDAAAPTPLWMVERLRRSGVRSISAVVDISNYVMFELGQPMHAFDLTKLQGRIHVRNARAGEPITLLDGREIALEDDSLCITDESGPVAIAGIMGGEHSGVADDTRDVFLESALFTQGAIVGKPRRYNAHTDSAARFERGVDPALQSRAIERMTELVLSICGGTPGPVVETEQAELVEQIEPVRLRRARIRSLLGCELPDAQVEQVLGSLGIALVAEAEGWRAAPPSRRYDIRIEEDLIEELARVVGYQNLPRTSPQAALVMGPVSETRRAHAELCAALVQRGYQEAVTYSFVDPAVQARFAPEAATLALANPIASDLVQMRVSLWPGLVQAVQRNQHRQQSRVRLFELGRHYLPGEGGVIDEPLYLAAAAAGAVDPAGWTEARPVDFFAAKGDLQAVIGPASGHWAVEAAEHPALHPGRSARVLRDGQPCGWIGELHPSLKEVFDLTTNIMLFEVAVGALIERPVARSSALPRFPSVRRDLAVVVPEHTPVAALVAAIEATGVAALRRAQVFDCYRGEGLPEAHKSVAFCLIFQEFSRTLEEAEINRAMVAIQEQLSARCGAVLRDS